VAGVKELELFQAQGRILVQLEELLKTSSPIYNSNQKVCRNILVLVERKQV